MRNSMTKSVRQSVALHAGMAMLLVGATIAIAVGFKAAGNQQSSQPANQQANQQSNQQPNQQATPPPRPAITMVSAEDAAREMGNPRSKWFREAKYGLFIHWGLYAI